MCTAVDWIGRGKASDVNLRFGATASHYPDEAEFCNPASSWEKGRIEKNVPDRRHRYQPPAGVRRNWIEAATIEPRFTV